MRSRSSTTAPPLSDLFADEFSSAANNTSLQDGGPRCPDCRALLAAGSNICIQCGLNFQTGKRHRRPAAKRGTEHSHSMTPVRAGLNLMCLSALLFETGSLINLFAGPTPLSLLPYALAAILGCLASILCVLVPTRTGAAPPIYLKLLFDLGTVAILVGGANQAIDRHWAGAIPILMLLSLLCFIFFLKHLARYAGRSDLADDAMNVIWMGVLCFFAMIGIAFVVLLSSQVGLALMFLLCLVGAGIVIKFGFVCRALAVAIRGQ